MLSPYQHHHFFSCFITYTHFHSPSFIIYFLSRQVKACIFSRTSLNLQNQYRYKGQMILLLIIRKNCRSLAQQSLINLSSIINLQRMIGDKNPKKKLESGNEIPYVGYGTYQLRGEECYKGVRWALEAGYTHIDTASIYKNEEVIGKVLQEIKVDRSKVFITSKIAPGEQGYKEARQACESILKRLEIGYLDLLIIHWPGVSKYDVNSPKNRECRHESWRALVELKKEGKVRDVGVSNFLKHHLQDLMKYSQVKPAINQFQIHPLLWEAETIDFCRKNNIAIQAYSPLARNDDQLMKNEIITGLAAKYHKTTAQICLRWGFQHGFIILPKSRQKNRINENMQIFDFEISNEDMGKVDTLRKISLHTCWDPNAVTI